MAIKRRSYIAIGVLSVLILGIAAFWWQSQTQGQVRVQTRLKLASANVTNTTNAMRRALGPDFIVSHEQTIKSGCVEASPDLSFTTWIFDCNATSKIELSSVQAISATRTEALIRAALGPLGIPSSSLDDVGNYVQSMNDVGSWQTSLPIDIPNTAIAGVPPFNYYGGVGQDDIGLQLASKIDQTNSKKTVLSVTAIQEYHTCKSYILPCVNVLAK